MRAAIVLAGSSGANRFCDRWRQCCASRPEFREGRRQYRFWIKATILRSPPVCSIPHKWRNDLKIEIHRGLYAEEDRLENRSFESGSGETWEPSAIIANTNMHFEPPLSICRKARYTCYSNDSTANSRKAPWLALLTRRVLMRRITWRETCFFSLHSARATGNIAPRDFLPWRHSPFNTIGDI